LFADCITFISAVCASLSDSLKLAFSVPSVMFS
jgi:hypothetical protein